MMKKLTKPMYTTLKYVIAVVVLIVIMVAASGGLRSRLSPGRLDAEPGLPIPTDGSLVTVAAEQVPDYVSLSGTVESERQINLSARLPAYVEAVHVNAGDRVPEGKLLIALDQRELREELAAAEANLQQAENAFQRSANLLKTDATTQQAHEAAESNYLAARAQAERVNVMLSYTRITAPVNGIVSDRFVEVGDLASMGQPLLTIFDPARLRIEVPVPASLISHFPVGATFEVKLDQENAKRTGTVSEVVSAFDPVTRTRRVKIQLEELDSQTALPGMYGQVTVNTGTIETILLPSQAITKNGQLNTVMIAKEGRLYRRSVRTGVRQDGKVSILSGLEPGDAVWIPAADAISKEGA